MANKKLSAIISIGGAVAGSLLGSIDKTRSKLGEVGLALKNLEAQQGKLGRAIQTFGRDGKYVDGMRQRYQALTREIEKQRAALEKVQKIEATRKRNGQLQGTLGTTAAVSVGAAVPAGMALNKSSNFNYDMQVIGNTANMKRGEIKKMGDDILNMSERVGQSSENLKNAVGFLVASGDTQAMKKIETIGKAATAAAAEIEDVAKASFTLQDALKIDPDKMGRALEMLVEAGNQGAFEFRDMAKELPVLGASFQALKFTGEEAVASMGAYLQLAKRGAATSSEAANNMGNFLNKILMPETLKKAQKLGGDLGAVVKNAQIQGANPIEAAIAEISRITKGGDQKLLGELFQDSEVQKFLRPVLQNAEDYKKFKKEIQGSKNVVDTQFASMMETSKKQTDQLTNSLGNLVIVIGTQLEPLLGKVTASLQPMVVKFREFSQEHPNVVASVVLVGGALIGLTAAITAARIAWGLMTTTMIGQAVLSSLATVATGIRAIGTAFLFVGRAMLLNPIGLAITVIAGGALLLMNNWVPVKAFFVQLWADIVAVFDKSADYIVGKIQAIVDKFNAAKATVTNFGSGVGDSVYNGVQATKSFFGVEDAQTRAYEASMDIARTLPPMATGRSGGASLTDSSQNTYNIYQQPGQDTKALAEEVTRQQRQRMEIMKRGTLFDGAMAQ